jgi:hypothetical protein
VHTYRSALDLVGVSVPGHLVAEAEVPVLTGPQCQGDVMIIPLGDGGDVGDGAGGDVGGDVGGAPGGEVVADAGVRVVRGEATGNTHWLHRGFASPGVRWAATSDDPLELGRLWVPPGESALLIHTDEHGANGIGPGGYVLHGKREQAGVTRRVAD